MESLLVGSPERCSVDEAFALCEQLARSHYENFTVGSWLLPRDRRRHFFAVYAFCRFVDDLGDEAEGSHLHLLDIWEQDLLRCYQTTPQHPYLLALQETIHTFDIPIDPFLKLIEANRIDQKRVRHPTYQDLDFYCKHSANPVGHLVLYLFGYRDPGLQLLSNYTCTALQLTNFWQDVARDLEMGRIYIPQEDMRHFGYSEEDLESHLVNDNFRRLMAFEVERARELFAQGYELVDHVSGNVRLDIALFSKGGRRILDAIEKQGYDVLSKRPTLSKWARVRLMAWTLIRMKLTGKV